MAKGGVGMAVVLWVLGCVGTVVGMAAQVSYQSPHLSHIRFELDGGHRQHTLASEMSRFLCDALGLGKDVEFRKEGEWVDWMDDTQQRWVEYYRGVRVENSLYHVHLRGGQVVSANGEAYQVDGLSTTPSVTLESAWETVKGQVGTVRCTPRKAGEGELVVIAVGDGVVLAFKFIILADHPCVKQAVFVDAISGALVKSYALERRESPSSLVETEFSGYQYVNTLWTFQGYRLYDIERGIEVRRFVGGVDSVPIYSEDNTWARDRALDVHYGLQKAYDYFKGYGLLGPDNKGGQEGPGRSVITGICSYTGRTMYLSPNMFFFNDDATMDTVGHEYTHAVTEHIAGLLYEGESGALDEGFSDIFGEAIENYAGKPAENLWKVGSEWKYVRDLQSPEKFKNPKAYGGQHWVPTVGCIPEVLNDRCGVHTNSGVLGHWFYLLAEGGRGTNEFGVPFNVEGVGLKIAEHVAYGTLKHMTPNSNYRYAMKESLEYSHLMQITGVTDSVREAWKAVGIEEVDTMVIGIGVRDGERHEIGEVGPGVLKRSEDTDSESRAVLVAYRGEVPFYTLFITFGQQHTAWTWCVSSCIDFNNNSRFDVGEVRTSSTMAAFDGLSWQIKDWGNRVPETAPIGEVLMRVVLQEGVCPNQISTDRCEGSGVQFRLGIARPSPSLQCIDMDPVTGLWFPGPTYLYGNFFFQLQVRTNGVGTLFALGNLGEDQVELVVKDMQTSHGVLRSVVLNTCVGKHCDSLRTTRPLPLGQWVGISGSVVQQGGEGSDRSLVTLMVGSELVSTSIFVLPRLVWRTRTVTGTDLTGRHSLPGEVSDLSVCFYKPTWQFSADLTIPHPVRRPYYKYDSPNTAGGGFSFSVFMRVQEYTFWGRIFDFGNGPTSDNIVVTQYSSTGKLQLHTYRESESRVLATTIPLPLGEWVRIMVVVRPMEDNAELAEAALTVGDQETSTGVVFTPRVVSRVKNYIGVSNWEQDEPLKADLRDFNLRFEYPDYGHLTLPHTANEGIFGGGFTLDAFVWVNRHTKWGRVFDYGNGPEKDNVVLSQHDTTGKLILKVIRDGRSNGGVIFATPIPLKMWVHIRITVQPQGENAGLSNVEWEMNGDLTTGVVDTPAVTWRGRNYIGKSNWDWDEPWDGVINTFRLVFDIEAPCFTGCLSLVNKMTFPRQQAKEVCASSAFGGAFEFSARLRFESLSVNPTIFMCNGGDPDDRIYLSVQSGSATEYSLFLCTRGATACFEVMGLTVGRDIDVDIRLRYYHSADDGPDVPGKLFVGGHEVGVLSLPYVVKRRISIGGLIDGTVENFRLCFE